MHSDRAGDSLRIGVEHYATLNEGDDVFRPDTTGHDPTDPVEPRRTSSWRADFLTLFILLLCLLVLAGILWIAGLSHLFIR